jgi:hypothetical protein
MLSFTPETTINDAIHCVRTARPIVTAEIVDKIEEFAKQGAWFNLSGPTVPNQLSFWDTIFSSLDRLFS